MSREGKMSEGEKITMLKKLKKGDKVKAKIGDNIIGYDILEMEFDSLDEGTKSVGLIHKIRKSRFNPKGRVDCYRLELNNLELS